MTPQRIDPDTGRPVTTSSRARVVTERASQAPADAVTSDNSGRLLTTATGRGGASCNDAHTCEATDDAPARRQGTKAGYPGKVEFGIADSQLRRALSRLARDRDPEARRAGAQLAQEATEALDALASRAEYASSARKRAEIRAAKLDAQLAQLGERHGRRRQQR